jgi:integrase
MNNAQLKSLLKEGKAARHALNDGLYFRITKEGSAFFTFRYTFNKKRQEMQLGKYNLNSDGMTLAEARLKGHEIKKQVSEEIDPKAELKRSNLIGYSTVNDVAEDWLETCRKRLNNPQIPERVYKKDIKPQIGDMSVERVNARDILDIVRKIAKSGRPTISNDALTFCKQIFNHGIKLGMIVINPAQSLTMKDAGGTEESRDRVLSLEEISKISKVMKENHQIFTRENYIAFILLLCLGVRKGELIAAKWSEFDMDDLVWSLPKERTKTTSAIRIPIAPQLVPYFDELLVRGSLSDYLFPSRRASRRRDYISDDTLNHALSKLFGIQYGKRKKESVNLFGEVGVEHFVVHDLRRTCRTLLGDAGVAPHIAERCLNHKPKGVIGIYDRAAYFDERCGALQKLAMQIIIKIE